MKWSEDSVRWQLLNNIVSLIKLDCKGRKHLGMRKTRALRDVLDRMTNLKLIDLDEFTILMEILVNAGFEWKSFISKTVGLDMDDGVQE